MRRRTPRTLMGIGRRSGIAAISVAVLAGLGAVTVFAFWSTGGSGSGSGTGGAMQPVTVAALAGGDAPNVTLLPGGPAADVILRISNPNAFAVTLVSVAGDGAITADLGHSSCTTMGVTFTNQASLSVTIPASSSAFFVDLPAAASMHSTSSNGCQGAIFSIPVAVTVHQG